jgi:predicted nuclease of predicted toxin-antitoxin system
MPEPSLSVLLDQNVPVAVADWLRGKRPSWRVEHVNALGLEGKPDGVIFRWAQEREFVVVTYDEDFADARFYPLGAHHGIIRLRVWPTTIEQTIEAMARVLSGVPSAGWPGSLIIVDNHRTRVRRVYDSR